MSGSAFAVTHHAFSSGAGRISDGNGNHASTLKSPSYTKSVSWQHYRAQAQNSYKDPSYNDDFGIETPSALDNFTQAIQSQILGGLLSNINTGKPGRMVTNDYIVDIANRDGQLQLNVTDRKTGQTSTIQVSGLQNNSTDF
ncbi:curli production assembly/transport component [Escherichia coli]|uniref:curli production assembly/transport protein CsgF n=1 Tax=Escherichia coli TaxID=562 RepID=UPI0006A05343|nr:curli production assembly/transport protein CsgF [Escherichia coli]CTW86462.1 curli production assembly/transport component [Escherichia coli]